MFWFRQLPDSLHSELSRLNARCAALEETVERSTLKWGELADITRRAQARWDQRERRDQPKESSKAELRRQLRRGGNVLR